MRTCNRLLQIAAVLIFGLLASGHAGAQATRTWVSGVGDDANPCSRTAPCKTFAGAISKTAAGGVIDVLDPGGFGAVTVTKSITLENVGEVGSVLVSGTDGIIVNDAGAGFPGTAVVTLRGLSLEGLGLSTSGAGLRGVRFVSGKQLIVERCDIGNFTNSSSGNGIAFTPSAAATLIVRDSTIHDNGNVFDPTNPDDPTIQGAGILIAPTGSGLVHAILDNVRLTSGPNNGLQVFGPASVVVRNSVIGENANHGIWAIGTSGAVAVNLENDLISDNTQAGVFAGGSGAAIHLSNSTITGSTQGIHAISKGSITSFGNNRIYGNTVNGTPTITSPLQ
jgi:hypothetical protein